MVISYSSFFALLTNLFNVLFVLMATRGAKHMGTGFKGLLYLTLNTFFMLFCLQNLYDLLFLLQLGSTTDILVKSFLTYDNNNRSQQIPWKSDFEMVFYPCTFAVQFLPLSPPSLSQPFHLFCCSSTHLSHLVSFLIWALTAFWCRDLIPSVSHSAESCSTSSYKTHICTWLWTCFAFATCWSECYECPSLLIWPYHSFNIPWGDYKPFSSMHFFHFFTVIHMPTDHCVLLNVAGKLFLGLFLFLYLQLLNKIGNRCCFLINHYSW